MAKAALPTTAGGNGFFNFGGGAASLAPAASSAAAAPAAGAFLFGGSAPFTFGAQSYMGYEWEQTLSFFGDEAAMFDACCQQLCSLPAAPTAAPTAAGLKFGGIAQFTIVMQPSHLLARDGDEGWRG